MPHGVLATAILTFNFFIETVAHPWGGPVDLILLTSDREPDTVLPSLSLLPHTVRTLPADVSSLLEVGPAEVALVDARTDLVTARGLCRRDHREGRPQ